MSITFTKMHGLGNDFMIIDSLNKPFDTASAPIQQWSNRHTGIGFDQCLVIEKSHSPNIDFYYRIFNATGEEVGQCGNGARCLMRYVFEKGLTPKKQITVKTKTTQLTLQLNHDNRVTINMGIPQFEPAAIPLTFSKKQPQYRLPLKDGQWVDIHALSIGNPHAVMLVKEVAELDITTLGPAISHHPLFPNQTNAGFMTQVDANTINLRVFERGSGETLACGSGAVAAAAVNRLFYQGAADVTVNLPGGPLTVHWESPQSPIFLTGTATFVYDGVLYPCES